MKLFNFFKYFGLFSFLKFISKNNFHNPLYRYYAQKKIRSIGKNSTIAVTVKFGYSQHISIGSDCNIGEYVHVYAGPTSEITMGDDVMIGPFTFINSDSFAKSKYEMDEVHSGHQADIHIADHVRIGAHAVILSGVKIGEGASIGAGAVVTKNVTTGSIVGGNPAKFIK